MQLREETKATLQEYITDQLWTRGKLARCPFHLTEKCGMRRHGTYKRSPDGVQITRFYCRRAHRTVSLLPDFLPSHMPGELQAIEDTADAFEEAVAAGATASQAAQALRPDIELQGATRWVARRRKWVRTGLTLLVTLLHQKFLGQASTVAAARLVLEVPFALAVVREVTGSSLLQTPWPVGLLARGQTGNSSNSKMQHSTGTDQLAPPG